MAVEADGALLVIDRGVAVVRVEAVTGNRTTISGCTESGTPSTFCIGKRIGIGPPFLDLKDIAVEADGSLAVIDGSFQVLMRVDPICGNRTVVSQ